MFGKNKFEWLKLILIITCGTILYRFEGASKERGILLLGVITVIALTFIMDENKPLKYVIEVIGVGTLMYYSRFTLNLMTIMLMVMAVFQAGIRLKWRENIWILILACISVGYNFYILTFYDLNYERKVEMIFIVLVIILINLLAALIRRFIKQGEIIDASNRELLLKQEAVLNALASETRARELLELAKSEVVDLTAKAERANIARRLHDDIGHEMTGLIMELEIAKRLKGSDQEEIIEQSIVHAREMLAQTRTLVGTLDDTEIGTLKKRIESRCEKFEIQTGIQCHLTYDVVDIHLGKGVEEVCYKAILECLTNVAKHTRADRVNIGCFQEGSGIKVVIEDNGGPTNDLVMGNGLKYMDERVSFYDGSLKINKKSTGLCIEIKMSLK